MINDYRIIVATLIANIELTGYSPVTTAAIKSWSQIDFVDEVLVLDGKSIDNTKNIIKTLNEKISFVEHDAHWPVNEWTWEYLHGIENRIFQYVNSIKDSKKILITLSSDTMLNEMAIDELKQACQELIDNENYDFINYPFKKAITKNFFSRKYSTLNEWHICSISKFRSNIIWQEVNKNEIGIKTNRPIKELKFDFKHPAVCYDMFCFTKEDIFNKISRHPDFSNISHKPSVDDYIKNIWLAKMKRLGILKAKIDDHPTEALSFIDNLKSEFFGYDLFSHVKEIL